MENIPAPVYMLKPAEDRESILANRTLAVTRQEDKNFIVLVTDRDYLYDPSGQKLDIVYRKTFSTLSEAEAELENQISLSLAAGLIHNELQYGPR
jgi:hypothetical protein